MISLDDSIEIIKKEYGKNISVLMVGHEDENIEEYEDFFKILFKDLTFINSYTYAEEYWDNIRQDFDLVIVHISKDSAKAKILLKKIREQKELIYILVFSTFEDYIYSEAVKCYCADACLPYPLNTEYSYRFLFRFLKRITHAKEMLSYIQILENMIHEDTEIKSFTGEDRRKDSRGSIDDRKDNNKSSKRRIEDNKLKNIRFNQYHKLTAQEFMLTLDFSVLDKVERFEEELDNYAMLLYDIENLDASKSLIKIQEINKILIIFSDIVSNITTFPIIEETFIELTNFLFSLEAHHFENLDQKRVLVDVLLGLGHDLERWIKAIFIEQSTNDIHYFDASFANNCVEIEALFHDEDIESDEGDLEFF